MSLYRIKDKTGQSGGVEVSNLLKINEKPPLFITPTQLSEAVSKLLSFGISQPLTDVERATALANLGIRATPEILYVLREPVIVSAPIADVPFIAATIPLPQGSLGNQNVDVRIEGGIRRLNGTLGYDLYISSSPTSLINGGKIATLQASSSSLIGLGFLRTFKFYTNGDIQGYNFENAQVSDVMSYGTNAQSIQPWADRSVDRYIHVVSTSTIEGSRLRVTPLSATKF